MFKTLAFNLRKIAILSSVALLFSVFSVQADENDPDRNQLRLQVIQLFITEQWAQLDSVADGLKQGLPTTKDKTFKISVFYNAIDETYFRDQMTPSLFDYYEKSVDKWIKNNPKSSSAYLIQASIMNARASNLRGQGYADKVDPAIWPEYNKILEKEKEFLIKHKDVSGTDPRWYEEMQVVAKLLSDEKLGNQTFEEGYAAFPSYTGIYLQAMAAQLPKWGGTPEGVEKVARIAAKNQTGLSTYAYIWYNALLSQPDLIPLLAQNKVVSWVDMRKGFEDELEENPNKTTYEHYLSSICAAGDKALYNEKRGRLKSGANPSHWLPEYGTHECD